MAGIATTHSARDEPREPRNLDTGGTISPVRKTESDMLNFQRLGLVLMAPLVAGLLAAGAAVAQEPGAAPTAGKQAEQTAGKSKGGDADLRKRVEQLEEQIVDMQVVIGTLESLARSGGGAAPARAAGAEVGRVTALEAQVRALQAKIDQIPNGRAGLTPPSHGYPPAPPANGGGMAWEASPTVPPPSDAPSVAPPVAQGEPGQYGSSTVNSATSDDIGTLIERQDVPPVAGGAQPSPDAPGPLAAIDSVPVANPKQDYEKAYGFLLQQNYGAAQAGFTDFLKLYPKDSLVPNALYWLGETHYVQRNYADAAEAFDIVTQAYGSSAKAPDSYLKRGMALAQLGKKQDACSMLGGLPSKYPSAPANVKAKADSERQRLGCS